MHLSDLLTTVFSEELIAEEQRAKERRARIRAAQKTKERSAEDAESDGIGMESDDSFM